MTAKEARLNKKLREVSRHITILTQRQKADRLLAQSMQRLDTLHTNMLIHAEHYDKTLVVGAFAGELGSIIDNLRDATVWAKEATEE